MAGVENNGGTRSGAGRKKASHTIKSEAMRKKMIEMVNEKLEPLINAYLDSALGLHIEVKEKDGKKRRYQKAPDITALKSLIDQAMGRAKESVEHSGVVTLEDAYLEAAKKSKENEKE